MLHLTLFIIFLVRFGLLSGHLLGNSCPLGWPFVLIVFCLFVIVIILLVRFGLLSGHLLGNSCPLCWPFVLIVFCLFVIFI